MVRPVTGGRNGLYNWMVQRATAVILLAYTLFLAGWFVGNPDLDYGQWRELFAHSAMKIFSLLALVALLWHAWVGMWTIGTDYLNTRMAGGGATYIRALYQLACLVLLFVYLVWCVQILWSV